MTDNCILSQETIDSPLTAHNAKIPYGVGFSPTAVPKEYVAASINNCPWQNPVRINLQHILVYRDLYTPRNVKYACYRTSIYLLV